MSGQEFISSALGKHLLIFHWTSYLPGKKDTLRKRPNILIAFNLCFVFLLLHALLDLFSGFPIWIHFLGKMYAEQTKNIHLARFSLQTWDYYFKFKTTHWTAVDRLNLFSLHWSSNSLTLLFPEEAKKHR